MPTIIDSLMNLVTPELLTKASQALGEDHGKLKSALGPTVASILGMVMHKGGNLPELESLLKNAASSNLLSKATEILGGATDSNAQEAGSGLTSLLFGSKAGMFTKLISAQSGISEDNSKKLLGMVSPLVAGSLGKEMASSGTGLSGLINKLTSEKDSFMSMLPSGLGDILGVSSLAGLGAPLMGKVKEEVENLHMPKTNGGGNFLKWLLPLLVAGGLVFLLSRSCNKPEIPAVPSVDKVVSEISEGAHEAVSDVKDAVSDVEGDVSAGIDKLKELISIHLPDGTELKGFKGGTEDKIMTFLTSEEFKTMPAEQLKDKWFDFDNINFKFGSSTELTEESQTQLKNIAAIIKHFKDDKVKIGAYTDKKGDEAANMEVSQKRAETIKKLLIEQGVPASQIEGAEGYGAKFAQVPADATDEERAKDRKIALRFEK